MPSSIKSPQQVSLASVSTKAFSCDASHLPQQRLRRQKSPFSGLWWPLAPTPVVLQGEEPKAKDTQLGSVFYNELHRLRGDVTENFSSKYFSKAGSAHFFSPNLYSIKTLSIQEQAPLCWGNISSRHKTFHCTLYWFKTRSLSSVPHPKPCTGRSWRVCKISL